MRNKLIKGGYQLPLLFALILTILIGALTKCHAQTKREVMTELLIQGVKCPRIVLKQAILETRWFTSRRCIEDNNLFGMKYARQRSTTAYGEVRDHAFYPHWKASIVDYKFWQDKYYSSGDYYEFLESYGYATSESYVDKLKQINL